MKGQLKSDGSLGKPETFDFVTAQTIADRLKKDGTNMCLTVGLSFRNPTINNREFENIAAIRWLNEQGCKYVLEAYYNSTDDMLHVTALTGNDLF